MTSPKVEKYVPRAITPDEMSRLLEQPGKQDGFAKPESMRDRAMLETLYSAGMRVSELVALDVDDIDLEKGGVRCMGKGGRERSVPLRPSAVQALQVYLESSRPALSLNDNPALFLNHRGSRLTRQGFWLILKSYAERGGHRRHYAAYAPPFVRDACLPDGAELRDVQQLLGHVSISTTQVYRRLVGRSVRLR